MLDAARCDAIMPPARPATSTAQAIARRETLKRLIPTSLLLRGSLTSPPAARTIYSRAMAPRPTRARYVVAAFAVALAVITYIDRVAIAVSVPFIREDLGLTAAQMGWALAAFGWAYALFEIPGGWLGDRIGPRRVLMRIVIWWSLFTAATGWAWNGASL